MANIEKNKGGQMKGDRSAPNFGQWWHHFNHVELMFLVNAINRRTKTHQVELNHLKAVNLHWTYYFLRSIELEFGKVGHMLNLCIRGKIKSIQQGEGQE